MVMRVVVEEVVLRREYTSVLGFYKLSGLLAVRTLI